MKIEKLSKEKKFKHLKIEKAELKSENTKLNNIKKILQQKNKIINGFISNKWIQVKTLKEYINQKNGCEINKIISYIDTEIIRENDEQKEKIKKIIINNYKKEKQDTKDDPVYEMAKSLESYINENFTNIVKELDWIEKKIQKNNESKSKIREKQKWCSYEKLIELKEKEYQLQLKIIKLQKEYDEIKYNINEKLKAYDWSTYEKRKKEFIINNQHNGK